MIVDAQVHFWKVNSPERPWLPDRVAQLPEPFTADKFVPMMDEAGVSRAVIVPPSWEGDRNDCALEAVAKYPGRFAIMGRIPVEDPKSAARLPDWKKQPGMVGVRLTFHPPQWKWLSDGTVDWFWPLAEQYGLPVMFYGAPMPSFAGVVERDMTAHIRRLFDAFGPRRSYWGTDLTNSYAKATYKQRITHFTETLDFLSAADKEWVMGRAILERLNWK
jgi:predicted TIM-barrel fold metal-dependent hydrolase